MIILDKKIIRDRLQEFYIQQYGERDTDKWFEQPAVNVWVFEREGEIITLKCNLRTGEVEEKIESF